MESEKLEFATDIAVEAGVLKPCERHIDYFRVTGKGAENAYRLGNAKFPAGGLSRVFSSRREMTDAIKQAVDHYYYPGGECPRCDQQQERD